MGIVEIIAIILAAALVIFTLAYNFRKSKKGGCCGGCGGCSGGHDNPDDHGGCCK